jgi:hypothetical protein
MNVYKKLYTRVNPYLKAYREDLTTHDQKTLQSYSGPFLYGHRETGTNILKLNSSLDEYLNPAYLQRLIKGETSKYCVTHNTIITEIHKELKDTIKYITYLNKSYLFFSGTTFKTITADQVSQIWTAHVEKLIADIRSKNPDPNKIFNL